MSGRSNAKETVQEAGKGEPPCSVWGKAVWWRRERGGERARKGEKSDR